MDKQKAWDTILELWDNCDYDRWDAPINRQVFQLAKQLYAEDPNFENIGQLLAICYSVGIGTEEDPYAAIKLYEDEIRRGNQACYWHIGQAYWMMEDEVEQAKCFPYFKKSIELFPDDLRAFSSYAKCFVNGVGTKKDIKQAQTVFERAANLPDAKNADSESFQNAYADFLKDCLHSPKCIEWYQLMIDNGSPDANLRRYDIGMFILDETDKMLDQYPTPKARAIAADRYLRRVYEEDKDSASDLFREIAEVGINELNIYLAENNLIYTPELGITEDWAEYGRQAVLNEEYEVAMRHYQSLLAQSPDSYEASVMITVLSNMNIDCDDSDSAIRRVSTCINNINRILVNGNVNNPKRFCHALETIVSQFALNVCALQFDRVKDMVASPGRYHRLSPVVFSKQVMPPRLKKLGDMVYQLGDNMEAALHEKSDISKCLWSVGNTIMSAYADHVGFFERMQVKSLIRTYKDKL